MTLLKGSSTAGIGSKRATGPVLALSDQVFRPTGTHGRIDRTVVHPFDT